MANTYVEVLTRASTFLEARGKEGHAIEYVFLARKQWTKTDWLIHMRDAITKEDEQMIKTDVESLLNDLPPQYLIGYEDFFGHRFKVSEATLIPRPETEELVDLCLKSDSRKNLSVVDIGTGTGAIAISLKLARKDWQVMAVDLSEDALIVAKENARHLNAEILFKQSDVLGSVNEMQDIIISNPPYISASEWELMDASVRRFEPKLALFAENDGLAIYQKIARESRQLLKPKGQIFLEIGFKQGEAIKQIFATAFPEKEIEVKKDLFGQERMVHVFDPS